MLAFHLQISLIFIITSICPCIAQKSLNMPGSPNFRELGGIANKEGLRIKEGYLYRSGKISQLSVEDMEIFSGTGINYILDLRSDFEVRQDPDTYPDHLGITRIHAPIGSVDSNWLAKWMLLLKTSDNHPSMVDQMMIEANRSFVQHLKDYQPLIDVLKEGKAVLWHCSAGKDRTGLASALVLSILGMEEDQIMQDYLLSNHYIANGEGSQATKYGLSPEIWNQLLSVKPQYLEAAIMAISEQYGSMNQMLESVFGLQEDDLQLIRSHYLTE